MPLRTTRIPVDWREWHTAANELMLNYLIKLISRLGHWGYLIIFLGAALECSAFLGLAVPGESLVLVGGFFAGSGQLDVGDLIIVVAIGAILGDSIGYELGRHCGRSWLLRYGRWFRLRQSHLDRVDDFFRRHGGKTIFMGRFIGFLRVLAPFVAGSSRMPYGRFLFYNATGAFLWSTAFVLIGYFVGASWDIVGKWIGRASAILGGALLVVLGMVWLWRWLVRHEVAVKERWQAFMADPRVTRLRRRFAPQLEFFRARLSPGSYLGLHLTMGALVMIGAVWLFGAIAEDVVTRDPLTVVDKRVAAWFHAHMTPTLVAITAALSYLGSVGVVSGITLLTALLLIWKRHWYRLLALFLTVPGGMLLNVLLKIAFARHRPRNPFIMVPGYSFPSGHAVAATLLYGTLAVLIALTADAWRGRVSAFIVAALLILLIAFTRVALGVHYLSDVLGGITVGLAWLALCLTAVDTLSRRRKGRGF
jgi:membrane protein DedA with SNARE-associated domain/membrane-associated phospholipid phosphatase